MYQEYNAFTIGFIEKQTIYQLKTPEGHNITWQFSGKTIQHFDLGNIIVE
jgi:hypothetical protein